MHGRLWIVASEFARDWFCFKVSIVHYVCFRSRGATARRRSRATLRHEPELTIKILQESIAKHENACICQSRCRNALSATGRSSGARASCSAGLTLIECERQQAARQRPSPLALACQARESVERTKAAQKIRALRFLRRVVLHRHNAIASHGKNANSSGCGLRTSTVTSGICARRSSHSKQTGTWFAHFRICRLLRSELIVHMAHAIASDSAEAR